MPKSDATYEVVSTSRGRVVTGPVTEQHEHLRRKRVRRALVAAVIVVCLFLGAGAYGLMRSTSNPDSPYNHPKQDQNKDPFGF